MKVAPNRQGPSTESLPENLFREPIDCLYAEHFRLQTVCDRLDQLASEDGTDGVRQIAHAIIAYLEQELPRHIADEEDLLPLLRIRCEPADDIDTALAALDHEHRNETHLCEALFPQMRRLAAGPPQEQLAEIRGQLSAISGSIRRHLAREEHLILPLARRRLLPSDMCVIGRRMAARRGITYPDD
jgi:hemerythrin-like domain-containing protein